MNDIINFLKNRRSVTAKKMKDGHVSDEHLNEIIESLEAVKNFVEIGPGKALSGMVKRTLKNVNSFSINSITDIKNLENEFKK